MYSFSGELCKLIQPPCYSAHKLGLRTKVPSLTSTVSLCEHCGPGFLAPAIQKLHRNECFSVLLTDVIDRSDVGVIRGRHGVRLGSKPGQRVRITRYILGQKLEGDDAVETSVLTFVYDTHPCIASPFNDAVVRVAWMIMVGGLPWRGILGRTYKQINTGVLDEFFFILNSAIHMCWLSSVRLACDVLCHKLKMSKI
jgi:hypothetical protein